MGTGVTTTAGVRSLFGVRDYRHLFGAQVIALLGTGLATVALALLAYRLAGSRAGAVLGTALVIKMVVYVTIAPIAGAYADRLPRRWLLVGLDMVRALVVLALPFVTSVWQVYVLIGVLQAASAAFTPTFQAVLPDILPDQRDYTRALSASQLAASMETLLSPALAAAVLTVASFHWLFAGTTVGFVASAMLVATSTIPSARPSDRTGPVDRIAAGMRIFAATPRLRGVLGLNLAIAGAGAIVMVNTVNIVRDVLGGDDNDVALLLAANGVGTIVVAACLPRLLDRVPERPVMLSGGIVLSAGAAGAVALSTVTLGEVRSVAAAVVWAVLGVGAGLVLTPVGRVLRRSAREADRPAVFAAQFSLSHACWLLSYPIAGYLVTSAGFTIGWLALAALTVTGTVIAVAVWPRRDPVRLTHTHPAPPTGEGHLADAIPAGAYTHTHEFIIDADHPRWPTPHG
ncbi:MFS transporter [Haloechinothrix salitolerans]|uniref:MFS transporter n=1 Tax=Haloechinothrix salitolerans TaxID=926830 RepID=A0ABW2C2P1_9PSEU